MGGVARRKVLLAAGLLLAVPVARAQREGTPRRIALLLPADFALEGAFREGLSQLGYVEGRNLTVDRRSAQGDFARLPSLAAELVRGRPEVIVAFVTQASIAAKQATPSIPVVMVAVGDPLASGLVASLARPGGNVTGTAGQSAAVIGKQIELVRQILPGATRLALLRNPDNKVFLAQSMREASSAAQRLGVELVPVDARSVAEIEHAFAASAARKPAAILVMPDPLFVANATRIAEVAQAHRLASFGGSRGYADSGMLASYGPDLAEAARRAARVVDRILRGEKPADIPVEFVEKFELVVNLRTARTLGIAVPSALQVRADDIIQ